MGAIDKKKAFSMFSCLYILVKRRKEEGVIVLKKMEDMEDWKNKKTIVVGVKMAQKQNVLCVLSEVVSSIPSPWWLTSIYNCLTVVPWGQITSSDVQINTHENKIFIYIYIYSK